MNLAYTVTWLEMAARPDAPRRALPLPGLSLIRARRPPVHFFRYLYGTVGADYEWTDMDDWSDGAVAEFAQDEAMHLNVAWLDGCPAGFVMIDLRAAPVADIAYFGLMPECVGRGMGSWLLLEGVHDAWDAGIDRLTVNTCTLDHPDALSLYRRTGFEPVRHEERVREASGAIPV